MSLDWLSDKKIVQSEGNQCHWTDSNEQKGWTSYSFNESISDIPNQESGVSNEEHAYQESHNPCESSVLIDMHTWRCFLAVYSRFYVEPRRVQFRLNQRRPPLLSLPSLNVSNDNSERHNLGRSNSPPEPHFYRRRTDPQERHRGRLSKTSNSEHSNYNRGHVGGSWRTNNHRDKDSDYGRDNQYGRDIQYGKDNHYKRNGLPDSSGVGGAKRIRSLLGRFDEWPSELKDYCKEVYRYCGKSEVLIEKAHKFILRMIEDRVQNVHSAKELHSVKWLSLALPAFLKTTRSPVSPSVESNHSRQSENSTRSLRYEDEKDGKNKESCPDEPISVPRTPALGSIVRLASPPPKRVDSLQKPVIDESINEMTKKRRNKFGNSQLSNEMTRITMDIGEDSKMDMTYEIQGLCTELEKNYLRLTSAPDVSTIRPLDVLEQAFEHVCEKAKSKDARYLCDQLRSIRQDLTVQNIKTDFTVRVYETNAMIALRACDREEFNQCQSRLMELYEQGFQSDNRCMFMGFRLLYNIFTKDNQNIMESYKNILDIGYLDRLSPVVSLFKGWSSRNWLLFFKSYHALTGTDFKLVADMFIDRERQTSLMQLIKAFRPTLSQTWISSKLCIPDSVQIFKNIPFNVIFSANDSTLIDCKASTIEINRLL